MDSWSVTMNQFKRLHSFREKKAIINFFIINEQVFFSTAGHQLFTIDNAAFNQKLILQMEQGVSSMTFYKEHYLLAWSSKGYGVYDNNFQPSSFLETEGRPMQV